MRPQSDRERGRLAALLVFAGIATATLAVALAALAGAPYLSAKSMNPGLVVFAIGLFAALFAAPFAIHARLGGRLEDDARWERSLLAWGALALVAVALGLLAGVVGGFGSDSLAGSVGAVTAAEALLVLATLVVWLIAG